MHGCMQFPGQLAAHVVLYAGSRPLPCRHPQEDQLIAACLHPAALQVLLLMASKTPTCLPTRGTLPCPAGNMCPAHASCSACLCWTVNRPLRQLVCCTRWASLCPAGNLHLADLPPAGPRVHYLIDCWVLVCLAGDVVSPPPPHTPLHPSAAGLCGLLYLGTLQGRNLSFLLSGNPRQPLNPVLKGFVSL